MKNRAIRTILFAAIVVVFPAAASAQNQTNMSFGESTGSSIQCTSSFNPYWGSSNLPLMRTSATGPDGSPSPVFRALGVSPYSLSYASRPNICVQFNPATSTGSFSAWITAYYGYNYQYTATVYATVNFNPATAFVNPKYVILGVMYAPPGDRSTVQYASNTAVGNSTSVSQSFSSSTSTSVSTEIGTSIKGVGSFGESSTYTLSYNQSVDSSSTVAVNQSVSNSTTLAGHTDAVHGLNHDYDRVFVWLNPVLKFRVATNWVQWAGYDWDTHDPLNPDMDVISIPLGCLTGSLLSDPSWSATCNAIVNGPFQRTWALPNADGSGPGLTGTLPCAPGSGTDLCNLMAADPFSDPNYTFTTADGRFTACSNGHCYTNVLFQPGITNAYSQTYSSSSSHSAGLTYSVGFSIDHSNTSSLAEGSFKQSLKTSTSISMKSGYSASASESNASTSGFNIVGPDAGYTGPMQFVVYQDSLYGTFLFRAP